jgi:type II secretory pathway pseudopilin PulG
MSRLHRNATAKTSDQGGFTFPDFLVVVGVLAVLTAVVIPTLGRMRSNARRTQCIANLHEVNRAVLSYAREHSDRLPLVTNAMKMTWWNYKELVKGHLGLVGPSSPRERVFACPNDRGYDEAGPFCKSSKFDYQSYTFNGVNVPGMPNIAGREVSSIKYPARTLLMMEWTAHAPLSWHDSKTGDANHPFYNNALNVVGFVDGHVKYIPIYYDGINAAHTRDPVAGYEYQYSGD